MESVKPLSDFFDAIAGDPRISITHIGIYAALLQYWSNHSFQNPIQVFSHEIMEIAKISSANTYHRCVRTLSEYGYIRYEPSFNKLKGSKIYLSNGGCPYGYIKNDKLKMK